MSRSVDLFVAAGDDPHELLAVLGDAGQCNPIASGAMRWEVHLEGALTARVYRHPYVDDGELRFTRYPWVVSVRVPEGGTLLDHAATTALRALADDLRAKGLAVLLVLDLQYRFDLEAAPPVPATEVAAETTDAAAS